MKTLMERLYDNIDEAKAFAISFTNFIYFYDDIALVDFFDTPCEICDTSPQIRDYLAPKANCKKPYGILHSLDMGVSQELRDELIANFNITEADFRPVRSKRGEVVFYQITPQHTMLPIYKVNKWSAKKPCPKCGSVRYSDREYWNNHDEPYYYISQEALDDMTDVNITYERFSGDSAMYVISRRVYDFLVERYPRTHYFPFFLK